MALSTQDGILAWRRIWNLALSQKPFVKFVLKALYTWLAQHGGNPDLQVVAFGSLSDSETVIANAACKLYGVVLVKGTGATATFSKMTDSATTSSDAASELRFWSNVASEQQVFVWPSGLAFANGITMQGNTTANGGTTSVSTDACSGYAIIGAA